MALRTWTKSIRWSLGIVMVIMVLLGTVVIGWAWKSQPQLDGQVYGAGLNAAVSVQRDSSDVPHIVANSPEDAAYALGWLHAAERGWQLEFNRRVIAGELSEILGTATLSADKTLRALGLRRAAQVQLEGMPDDVKASLQAYANGINGYWAQMDGLLTPEFTILGVDPRKTLKTKPYWEPVDSVGWALVMALDLGGNWGKEIQRMQLSEVLPTSKIWDLMPAYPGEAPATATDFAQMYKRLGVFSRDLSIGATPTSGLSDPGAIGATFESQANALGVDLRQTMAESVAKWVDGLGHTEGLGSNNWVVNGSRSASGQPLLANDPHLGLSAPAIWYFAHLRSPASRVGVDKRPLDVIGATLPGMPFVVLGHTRGVAWGFTNTGPDVQDLYLEQIDPQRPDHYRLPNTPDGQVAWAPFETRQEVIKVKGQPDTVFTVRSTRHGPVISDNGKYGWLSDRFALALRWTALDADNMTMVAGFRGNRAQTVDELFDAYRGYHSPMQNVVAADTTGMIRYQAVGRVPVRAADHDLRGVAPAPGWESRFQWIGWLSPDETPRDDGAEGWVGTANQRIHGPDYPHFLTQDWVVPHRMNRIEQLMGQTKLHTIDSFKAMQNDVLSLEAQRWLPLLRQVDLSGVPDPRSAAARDLLFAWDGQMSQDSRAALVLNLWLKEFGTQLLRDRLGEDVADSTMTKRNQFRPGLLNIVENKRWCGDCHAQLRSAWENMLERADGPLDFTQSTWGEVHQAVSSHRPFGQVPVLRDLFDVRQPSGGDGYTINVGQYHIDDGDQPFASRHAASLRAIYDLSNLENSVFIYQTGQSGNVFSPRYRDMAASWANGEYRPLRMKPTRVVDELKIQPDRAR